MRIVVTGGAGFIGSNLTFALLNGGHDVLIVDDLSSGSMDNVDPRAAFRRLDILDDAIAGVFAEFEPDAVIHLAAQSSVTASLADPQRDRLINAEGARLVAAAARDAGAARFLFASSAAVYGEPSELPLSESAVTSPINPYGASKLEAESLVEGELLAAGVDFANFRFSNVYGPRQDAHGEGGVVAIFCDLLAQGTPPTVYGDGTQTRDFIFVGDIVAAVFSALAFEGSLSGAGGLDAVYNISTGVQTSLSELVMTLRQTAQYFGAVNNADPRTGDIVHSALDPSHAAEVFGWRAAVGIERGIALTWNWFSRRP